MSSLSGGSKCCVVGCKNTNKNVPETMFHSSSPKKPKIDQRENGSDDKKDKVSKKFKTPQQLYKSFSHYCNYQLKCKQRNVIFTVPMKQIGSLLDAA